MHSEDTVVCEEIRGELQQYLGENGDSVIYIFLFSESSITWYYILFVH